MRWRRRYSGSRLLETRNRQGSWEVTLNNLLPRVLHWFWEYWVTCHVKRCVNMWMVCAQPDGSLRSLLQSTGSSPYVLVHIVGPLAATIRSPETRLKNHKYTCARWKYSTREHSFLFNKVISIINQFSSWGCNFYSFFLNFI